MNLDPMIALVAQLAAKLLVEQCLNDATDPKTETSDELRDTSDAGGDLR